MAKRDSRPINVGIADLLGFKWPVTALASIAHRIAGVGLFVGVAIALAALEISLGGAQGFATVKAAMVSPVGKVIVWLLLAALIYHFIAGVKHLAMDLGIGETMGGARFASWFVILASAALIALTGLWLW